MKKTLLILASLLIGQVLMAQNGYWVFLTDKNGTSFDPYSYFDAHAIARYQQCGADLYDATNYPVPSGYSEQIGSLATETIGVSRWLNAVAVLATDEQIAAIGRLPFVKQIVAEEHNAMLVCRAENITPNNEKQEVNKLSDQLLRMQGDRFVSAGLDGTGVRIAVFDGGFPNVDHHEAFKHLRDNHRIIDTWNFPNNKENVYGWNSHGTMTLSCITGMVNGEQLGLATGAEFMLYRTEVNLEPFKEEVWWMMAVERADQHGANIISSSLGYGKERYYTKDMDGSSYVAQAANMAARKGILVCNSAGNEADSKQWKTIITPADADSVLCVGGIESSLKNYAHISFSSYGPSSDGRLKPNVSAFGHAKVASPSGDNATDWVFGTSFSCPLTAGFAACALQSNPSLTAMQLKEAIEHSGDLYPYFDYALGYGVPQAGYFVDGPQPKEPSFSFSETNDTLFVIPSKPIHQTTLFANLQNPDGTLLRYASYKLENVGPEAPIAFDKRMIGTLRFNVWLDGYTQTYQGGMADSEYLGVLPELTSEKSTKERAYNRGHYDLIPSNFGSNASWRGDFYWQFGTLVNSAESELTLGGYSPANHLGFRLMRAWGKSYCLGMGFEWGMDNYHFVKPNVNNIDQSLLGESISFDNVEVMKKYLKQGNLSLELFQRIRFVAGGPVAGKGLYWDLGAYASYNYYSYNLKTDSDVCSDVSIKWNNPQVAGLDHWNWGLTTRFGYDMIAVYARYCMSHILDETPDMKLPRLEIGLQLAF